MADHAQDFADRLTTFEQDRDVEAFVSAAFSPDIVLLRPETGQELEGHDGARTFWSEYLTTFEHVRSTFSRVLDGEVGVLEWTSEARLAGGRDITYRGASLLDVDGEGLVRRFATYYDTRLFQPTSA
ncbi:SnoaL-like domain-containing protein [Microlunatus sagamiharensis]|uniref:SnoaL-like domain-containing protein n=1 Tax=Microlunatus sagamiharensis TaxID=546874 RepID=A0A1H2LRL9_9ACTN|nr:nuclear transport factor 2 family protein [Microlunatus sagamiharensis]SDU83663.1 SnoaL-like domain-containing protein [Microlunatus sagamiharensis]